MPIAGSVGSVSLDAKWVAGRMKPRLGLRERHPDGVVDRAGGDLVVAHQTGQDRQAGGVGARPAERAQSAGEQVESGAGRRATQPAPVRRPTYSSNSWHVSCCSTSTWPSLPRLDRRVERDRERPGIALVAVGVVGDRHQRLRRRNDDERDAVRRVLAEVGVQRCRRRSPGCGR